MFDLVIIANVAEKLYYLVWFLSFVSRSVNSLNCLLSLQLICVVI